MSGNVTAKGDRLMRKSIFRSALFVIGACLLAAASCDHEPKKPDPVPGGPVADGGTCGTIAGLACASPDSFCAMPVGSCQIADGAGTCTPKPEVCTAQFEPVCGCDGNTYGNACAAAAAGMNIASEGECPQQAQSCGGLAGQGCGAGEFCNITDGSCGAADQTGVCTAIPQVCTREFVPVCGCNGQTFGNACGAAAAGISIVSQGACP